MATEPTSPPTVTALPTAPSRSAPSTFRALMDAFLAALVTFGTQASALATWMQTTATQVFNNATEASNAATSASAAANYQGDYDAGTTYTVGQSVSFSGAFWMAKQTTTGNSPTEGANWTKVGGISASGGIFTGGVSENHTTVTSTSNAMTIDCDLGNDFTHVLTENTTVSFTDPPASGSTFGFSLEIVQDASASGYTVTWPASVRWPAATAPTLTADANAIDVFVFKTDDAGTTWYGFVAGQAMGVPA